MVHHLIFVALTSILFMAEPAAGAEPATGFLYGSVVTESGTEYRGFLRWGTQEAFWDDLFHSRKDELPYREVAEELGLGGEGDRAPRNRVRVFNFKVEWGSDSWQASRVFIARFGDIEQIEVTGSKSANVVMRNGDAHAVTGYSDDVGGKIHVADPQSGAIELAWNRIATIRFESVPPGADPGVGRLYGTVDTRVGRFEGYVMWDKEECTTADLLDGDSEDGRMAIEMGRIASIERRGRRACVVQLKDGRQLRLRGTNDVNQDNRGIMIEDERYGKVTVPWSDFDRLELRTPPGSGRGYDDYPTATELRGRVETHDGRSLRGRLVFDLDEASTWEILNGRVRDVEFDIPFAFVASIRPDGRDASIVELFNGERLNLEDSQDVSERNDGVLVYADADDQPVYLPWSEIEAIEFDR